MISDTVTVLFIQFDKHMHFGIYISKIENKIALGSVVQSLLKCVFFY